MLTLTHPSQSTNLTRLTTFGITRLLSLMLILLILPGCSQSSKSLSPELIIYSGDILSVNQSFDRYQSMAISDGRILELGTNQEILSLAGDTTKLIDLKGATVIPGLIDSHSHPENYGLFLFRPDLSKAESVEEIVQIISEKVDQTLPGDWVTNSGFWNEKKLKENRNPTRFDLDPVSPENPVFLRRGHLAVVNSKALEILGMDDSSPDPKGGTLERDLDGKLTGRLYERAIDLVREAVPELTEEELMESIRKSYEGLAAAGITSVRSAATSHSVMRAFLKLQEKGDLALRTSITVRLNPNQAEASLEQKLKDLKSISGWEPSMLSLWGVKMTADGGSDLAFLRKDYANRPGFRGQLGGPPENFARAARLCNRYDIRLAIHALGDAAIDMVLDSYEEAHRENSISGKRWSIEHGYLLQPEHFPRIKNLELVIHPQTWHLYNLRRNFLENYGRNYADMSHPYRTLLEHGISIAGGTDWQLEPSDQFFYMWVSMTRRSLDGEVVDISQSLTREEALRFHTSWAAYSTFEENTKGSLEEGKLADLVVLPDYMNLEEDEFRNLRPLLTMVGGKIVYQSKEFVF
jgi:predicted amidohydrolase YtcJ